MAIAYSNQRYTSEDVHRALFEEAPEPRTFEALKQGVRQYVRCAMRAVEASHLPLGTFDRDLSKLEGAQRL